MRSTQLVLIRGGRVCMAPSLYLDQHGEDACGERQDESESSDGPVCFTSPSVTLTSS